MAFTAPMVTPAPAIPAPPAPAPAPPLMGASIPSQNPNLAAAMAHSGGGGGGKSGGDSSMKGGQSSLGGGGNPDGSKSGGRDNGGRKPGEKGYGEKFTGDLPVPEDAPGKYPSTGNILDADNPNVGLLPAPTGGTGDGGIVEGSEDPFRGSFDQPYEDFGTGGGGSEDWGDWSDTGNDDGYGGGYEF